MQSLVFLNVLKVFRRVISGNLGSCSDYDELAREVQARIAELDVIIQAYEGEIHTPDYNRLVGAVDELRELLEGVAVPVFVEDHPDTLPVTTPPPPEAAYHVRVTENRNRGTVPGPSGIDVSAVVDESEPYDMLWTSP